MPAPQPHAAMARSRNPASNSWCHLRKATQFICHIGEDGCGHYPIQAQEHRCVGPQLIAMPVQLAVGRCHVRIGAKQVQSHVVDQLLIPSRSRKGRAVVVCLQPSTLNLQSRLRTDALVVTTPDCHRKKCQHAYGGDNRYAGKPACDVEKHPAFQACDIRSSRQPPGRKRKRCHHRAERGAGKRQGAVDVLFRPDLQSVRLCKGGKQQSRGFGRVCCRGCRWRCLA